MILSRTTVAALALAGLLAVLVALRPLLPIDETRYLSVAWEMWLSGDWFHLTRNSEIYAHKPPLLFWTINLVWGVTGVHEFAARLVGPAFAVALAVATARLGRSLWPGEEGIGARSVMVLAGFTVFLIYASTTMFDAMLGLAAVLGVTVLWRIGQGGAGLRHWAAFGAALAFGTLAKGPVIFVHLLPVLLTMRFWAPVPPRPRDQLAGLGLAVATGLAIVGLWLVPALVAGTAEFRRELLWTQSAARVAGGLAHDRPVWFFLALLPLLLFPWGWSPRLWRRIGRILREDRAARMLAVWAGSAAALFSVISGKQVHYLLPEYAPVALLVARALPGVAGAGAWRATAVVPLGAAVAAGAAAAGLMPAAQDLVAGAPDWVLPLVAAGCLGLALAVLLLARPANAVVAGAGMALAAHLFVAASGLTRQYDSAAIVARIDLARDRGIAVVGMTYNAEFNFGARLTSPVATPATPRALKDWSLAHPGGLVLGPVGRVPVDAPPAGTVRYNGLDLGFWPAETVAVSVLE
ncbi:MAG: hypothetical protein F9K34_04995 [Albidovulum sp.]|uniref:ArnT family glycosyltransferase n=1 Tax=Albidovulum sp. TaxID=1872424 RepID=UPI00132A9C07|nr:glycosyltransferase family 39 protein [Defluviimonas sp.]KAB2885597.1 MAG: hypothetical protein F9K34_04995 [Defluviimonas sp.]